MFPKVKNVNVKSLKNRSKLLDFWSGSLPQPLPVGKGFSNYDMRLYMRVYMTPPWKCFGRRCVGFCVVLCRVLDAVVLGSVLGFVYSWCIV